MLKYLIFILLVPAFTKSAICQQSPSTNDLSNDSARVTNASGKSPVHNSLGKFSLISSSHTGVAADYKKPLQIIFNQPVDAATLKNVVITQGGAEGEPLGADRKTLSGKWSFSNDLRTIIFKPFKKFKPGIFVSVTIPETFKSLQGAVFTGGKDVISFIMDNGMKYGQRVIRIDTLKIVDNNRIPLIISVPDNSEKHPVMIFVHGGGWTGGTENLSPASLPVGHTASYLCDKLGVAVVGVGYRCIGSKGSFAKAKADIEDAVRYVKAHANEYNLDLSRMGICGESAGAPLSALIAQEDKDIRYYIGWNGI